MGKCVRVEPKEGGSEKDLTENAIILKEHQERVRERLQKQDGLILDHGLGSGKTISAIAAAEDFGGAVVVTPASLRENFKKELRRYQAKGQYDVMSYEEFVRDRPNLVGRMLIVDEAHRLANSSTKRTQAIAEEASKASKRLLLTATPLQNRPSDASTLVNIAAGEKILPVGEADFRRKYLYRVGYVEGAFDNIFRGVPTYGSLKPKNLDEYRRKVSRYVDFYAPNQEGFPTVAKHTVNIPMSKAQARAQEAWLKEMPPDMKQRIKDGRPPESGDISRLNTFMNATRQTANTGGAYGATEEDLSPKVAAIADRIADSKGKVLVYSNYIDSGVAPLEKALKQKGISSVRLTGGMSDRDRAQIVRDYNNDKFRTLIISSAGGEGLDLKKTEQIHVMEPHWNDEKINQVIGRGVRYKSHEGLPPDRQHVDVYKYVSVFPEDYFLFWNRYKGLKTADEYLALMSERKMELNSAFLNSYRRRSDAVLNGIEMANSFLTRLDRRPPAKCDPKRGWERGAGGKCVRSKPISDNPTAPSSRNKNYLPVAGGVGAIAIGSAISYAAAKPEALNEAAKKALGATYFQLISNKDRLDRFIESALFLSDEGKQKTRRMLGGVKVFVASNIKKLQGYTEVENGEDDRITLKAPDGGIFSISSAGSSVLTFESKFEKNFGSDGSGFPGFEMAFKVDESFSRPQGGRQDIKKAKELISKTKKMFSEHLGLLPENCLLSCSAFDEDDAGSKRKNIYESNGFRSIQGVRGKKMWAVKNLGELTQIPERQDEHIAKIIRGDSLYRGDRRPPAKCDPSRGWKQGAGKCVRVKPVDEEPSSPRVFGRKTDITSDRAYHARLGRLGLLGGGVAVTAILGAAAYQVSADVKKIKPVPSEEEETVDYDSFEPGDLLRRRTSMADIGVYHYAIYAGKDPKTGEHKIIHAQAPDDDYQGAVSVITKSTISKKGSASASPSASAADMDKDVIGGNYLKVPREEMYGKQGASKFSREEILSRAESLIGADYTFHVFSSNCETFARGMVEGVSYSSQADAVSPLTRFLGDTLTKVAASTLKKDYLFSKTRRTSEQMIRYLSNQSKDRKDSARTKEFDLDRGLVNVLGSNRPASPPRNLLDAYCDQVGIKRPDDYTKLVNELSRPLGTTKKAVQVKMYTDYAKMFFGTLRSQDILGKERSDSIRLDRRLAAKCDPRYGWKQGAGGKCVRARKPDVAMPRKGEALAASLGSYEINPDTGRPYKIRELRGIAREKGLVGYGSMTTGQMKSAMRLIDESPEDAQRKNLIKTFSRDRSISSKAIAAGLGNVKGNSPAGRRLIKEVKEANLTFKRFAALMKFASTSPAGWGVLGAAAFLGERTIAQWGKVKDDYRKGLDESAKIAASRVPNVNVRHPTPANPKGQFFRPSASRATGKKTGSENITFVVSGAASGASRMIEDLRQLGKAPKATEAEKWMSRNNFVPIDLKETRVASADGGLDEAVQMMGDFMQNRKRGRNQDAVDLASSLFAHATAYPDKRVNLIAHGAGGLATKEALEILSRMEVKKGNRVIKGKDLVGKFNVVLLGTPHFGYTETVAQNTRTVTSPNDPFSRIPFSGGGMRPQWISSVKGHKPSDYLSDASVREAIRESFGYYRTDSASLEP